MATILYRCRTTVASRILYYGSTFINEQKCFYTKQHSLRKTIYKSKEITKIRMNILTRYIMYVKNYDTVIEKKFPNAMHLYRTFKGGVKEFYQDLKKYIKIIRNLNTTADGLKSLSLNEIELYHKMPRDMIKIAPVLLLSALPMTNYIIFPLTYLFPRQLLCSHFWTLQQRAEFQMYYLRKRLIFHRPTLRSVQEELITLKKNHHLFKPWAKLLGLIGSGVQPTTNQILECKPLFSDIPYHLNYLKGYHVKNLLKMHGMSTSVWLRRTRLKDRGRLLQAMDKAIQREKGVNYLSYDALKYACYIRGLNPVNMKHEDMVEFLKQWLLISENVDLDSISLLLHCPILLAYNQPSNWLLIYF